MDEKDNKLHEKNHEDTDEKSRRPQCSHYHTEVTNSCSGRCKLLEHVGTHVCGTCGERWG